MVASEDSSHPWFVEVEAAGVVTAGACWASGHLVALDSCFAWLGLGAHLVALAWPAAAEALAAPEAFQAALACPVDSGSQHTWQPAA